MIVSIIAFTDRGRALSRRVAAALPEADVTLYARDAEGFAPVGSVRAFAQRAMAEDDAVIFVGAAGIAVRAAAPFLRGKDADPAVLVLDENGRFVISLLSGHLGGANRLTERLARELAAIPVITTATDGRGLFAADDWAAQHGCAVRDTREIRHISAALLRGEAVGWRSDFPHTGALPAGLCAKKTGENGILLSVFAPDPPPFAHTLQLIPRIVHVGIGCRRGASPDTLRSWAERQLSDLRICPQAVASVASIDRKSDEPAVLALAQSWNVPARFYTADELNAVSGDFPPSDFVRQTTGTDNVCQRAAARAADGGTCLLKKTACSGMTISVYCEHWRAEFCVSAMAEIDRTGADMEQREAPHLRDRRTE